MAEGQLLLWGDTQVGKTALLATAIYSQARSQLPLDRGTLAQAGAESNRLEQLQKHWNRLVHGQHSEPTDERTDLTLPLLNGNTLKIHDIVGGTSENPFDEEFFRAQRDSNPKGVLFVVEWEGRNIENHILAISNGLLHCGGFKIGLAITKCENALADDDPAWQGEAGWWREHGCWKRYSELMDQFAGQVWATSAFGFDLDGRPACILGEYGLMPFGIRPQNVAVPFAWFVKEFGL